ncbi:ferredoxin family protein [Amycolatopsis acidiphila]|uniref:Ferredoxin n=1 Tax=Amycolatopsis acidiphila TaxID=715473 RepID=A0A558AL33_9PSEU|nr:ferredoxin [Amycolatopsis acidiphila]TVT24972.1 ferredoxin family protein [Amycolatopsis acidiphila]UIJ57523.1 ferredoxin family protein [Amycolatopsis acidiphila]GHG89268.1 ferredoxin [Amycolatopsis acidiphila]
MAFVIGEPCVDEMDKSCVEECPVDCIYEGERMMYIHPAECIDCGACEVVCPVEAIRPAQRLDERWLPFQESSRSVFAELGSPGGSPKVDGKLTDPPFVADLVKEA